MSLEEIKFEIKSPKNYKTLDVSFSHIGVVGSGDLEILFMKSEKPNVNVKIVTPVKGFDHVWKQVVERFVQENELGGINIEINDNNATPFVVSLRLKQALAEAEGGGVNG